MAPTVEISIPTSSISEDAKPHTVYHITLRLPLRSFTVRKRYSDFIALDQSLRTHVGAAPPAPLPQKSWFARTVNNPALTEERRKALEHYLRTLNETNDSRWRTTELWRTFLNLPASAASTRSSAAALGLHGALTSPARGGAPITDPVVWIDCHRDLKSQLHDARLHLQRRDQSHTAQQQRESSAAAKRSLVLAGSMITALDRGLKTLGGGGVNPGSDEGRKTRSEKLGEGELRRRRDLLMNARKEKEALEALANSIATRTAEPTFAGARNGSAAASTQQKSALFGNPATNGSPSFSSSSSSFSPSSYSAARHHSGQSQSHAQIGGSSSSSRRVLGSVSVQPETDQTRELDNRGVLQLLKEQMHDQDQSVEEMTKGVMRLKELGIAINDELEVQNPLLNLLDEDVTRVGRKLEVAKKRINKIS
ncbi:MAG: hypothetical protein M1815_002605 [Lichina confinis]|nr:MAG: hypothetical protein M1815_002605 [Lichina confinis]